MPNIRKFLSILGPGLLMAGAAIGVSHLVQSTRAGAEFGYSLIGLVLLINLLKYPFFEYGHRYTVATGNNLLEGYKNLGKSYLIIFLVINFVATMGSVTALFFVTSSLIINQLGYFFTSIDEFAILYVTIILITICTLIYNLGRYNILDMLIKIMMIILLLATIIAFIMALYKSNDLLFFNINESAFQIKHLPFLLALMGWLPGPIEMSVWQSLWIKAKEKNNNTKTTMREAAIDFNIGYMLCVVLSVIFVALGAIIMHKSGAEFSKSGVKFASQLVDLYTENIGSWAKPLIGLCALITIFSTSLTLYDAYPRSLAEGCAILTKNHDKTYIKFRVLFSTLSAIFAICTIYYFLETKKAMTLLVDIVTILAFISAPFFAFLNTKLIFQCKSMPESMKPSLLMKILSIIGIIFMTVFMCLFITSRIL